LPAFWSQSSKPLPPADLRADQLNNAVREGHAVTTELGANASAVTYWVARSDGWHVVTTVGTVVERNSDADKHAVVRFSSVLLPGQSQLISVPFAIGEQQQVLRIRRLATGSKSRASPAPHESKCTQPKGMKMKNSKILLLDYLASVAIRSAQHRFCGRRRIRTAVPALARGRTSLTPAAARSRRWFASCSNSIRTSHSRRRIQES